MNLLNSVLSVHMGNYSQVVMVITSENNGFTTRGLQPLVVSSLFSLAIQPPIVNNFPYAFVMGEFSALYCSSVPNM